MCIWLFAVIIAVSSSQHISAFEQHVVQEFPVMLQGHSLKNLHRIVGGKPAKKGELPYQAIIGWPSSSKFELLCGGVLISTKWVLTAAHCFPLAALAAVALGKLNLLKREPEEQHFRVKKAFVHAQFKVDRETVYNDIALIQLDRAAKLNEYVKPILLPSDATEPAGTGTASGWGSFSQETGENSQTQFIMSKILQKVQIPLIPLSQCSSMLKVTSQHLCAGNLTHGGKDSCRGDSGGPLVCDNHGLNTPHWAYQDKKGPLVFQNGKRHLCGLVSYGFGCAMPNSPAVYTRIGYHVKWIKQITGLYTFEDPYLQLMVGSVPGAGGLTITTKRNDEADNLFNLKSIGVIGEGVFDKGSISCLGALVHHDYFLTPVHCLKQHSSSSGIHWVRFPSSSDKSEDWNNRRWATEWLPYDPNKLLKLVAGQAYHKEKQKVHGVNANDAVIAILKLTKNVSSEIKPMKAILPENVSPSGLKATMVSVRRIPTAVNNSALRQSIGHFRVSRECPEEIFFNNRKLSRLDVICAEHLSGTKCQDALPGSILICHTDSDNMGLETGRNFLCGMKLPNNGQKERMSKPEVAESWTVSANVCDFRKISVSRMDI